MPAISLFWATYFHTKTSDRTLLDTSFWIYVPFPSISHTIQTGYFFLWNGISDIWNLITRAIGCWQKRLSSIIMFNTIYKGIFNLWMDDVGVLIFDICLKTYKFYNTYALDISQCWNQPKTTSMLKFFNRGGGAVG